jgi:hypothetical protein
MAEAVYILCALTSLTCAALLFRAFLRTKVRLLLWTALCFGGFALNNIILYIDLIVLPSTIDLSVMRVLPSFFGICALLYGLICEEN